MDGTNERIFHYLFSSGSGHQIAGRGKTIATSVPSAASPRTGIFLSGHPEFRSDYSAAAAGNRRALVGDARTDSALAIARRTDAEIVASWIGDFSLIPKGRSPFCCLCRIKGNALILGLIQADFAEVRLLDAKIAR